MQVPERSDCKLLIFKALLFLLVFSILSKPGFSHSGKGDINNDGSLDLSDLILSLQVVTGMDPIADLSGYVESGADVNNDGRIGLEESIYILQQSQYRFPHNVAVMTSGIEGNGLTLVLNGKEELAISTDGLTSFQTKLNSFSNYQIDIKTFPTTPNQGCKLSNATGMVIWEEVVVSVDCSTNGYPVGGIVTGLDGVGLSLALEDLTHGGIHRRTIKANGDYILAGLLDGSEYNVTILSQPTEKSQTCTLSNGSGTIVGAAVANISVNCTTKEYALSGYGYGLDVGESIVITNNASHLLPKPIVTINGTTTKPFLIKKYFQIPDGGEFELVVTTQPSRDKTCQLTNPSGVVQGATVTNIDMFCFSTSQLGYSIGGIIYNLGVGNQERTVTLGLNNGLEHLSVTSQATITGNTEFDFTRQLGSGSSYAIEIIQQPVSAHCTVDGEGSGTVIRDISDVHISCVNYIEPASKVIPDSFVPNGGVLDGSESTLGSATDLTYSWETSSVHDFVFINNGTIDPTGVTVQTDKFGEPIYFNTPLVLENPLFFDDSILFEDQDEVVFVTTMTLGVADLTHTSTDSATNYIYNEKYAYVKKSGTGTGASPDNATGDIKAGIAYANANGKSRVAIAQGTYTIDIDDGPVKMVEGISLYGGYSPSTWEYDPKTYRTEIRAQGTGINVDVTPSNPLNTVSADSNITETTRIQGLNIYGPLLLSDLPTTALLITGGNVTVKDNTLIGTNQRNGGWSGLTITNQSNSLIKNNIIIAHDGPSVSDFKSPAGIGLAIYGANPIINSNRIRGGGAVGRGILVYDSHPDIFNNMILGCEDQPNSQACYGVMYLGLDDDDAVDYADSSGGKLYNNTIFGGMSYSDSDSDKGGESIAVYTIGKYSAPDIVNNILYSQSASGGNTIFGKTACINSDTISPGVLPASIYNNACIRSSDGCFHHLWVKRDVKWYETLFEWSTNFFIDIYNEFVHDILLAPARWPVSWVYDGPVSLRADHVDLNELLGEFTEVCRTAEGSNADVVYQQYLDQYADMFEFFGFNLEWLPSGGNIDIVAPNFFVDIDGPDNNFSTIEDNDWNLIGSTPADVIQGGKCTAPDNYRDMDGGANRTPLWSAASGCFEEVGYSMGAYEYNY